MLCAVALAVALLAQPSATQGASYTLPRLATFQATVPPILFLPGELHLLCRMRLDAQGSAIDTREVCYQSVKPAPPPGLPVANVQPIRHEQVAGTYDGATGAISLTAFDCVRLGVLGVDVHVSIQLDKADGPSTGTSTIIIDGEEPLDCAEEPAIGSVTLTPIADWETHDEDGDGCPDRRELGDEEAAGGLRDPFNPYDYMNPTRDGENRVDDILAVVAEYFRDDPPGAIDLRSPTDRTALGPDPWNLGPPNGQQRVDDILSQVKQYFHDCEPA